jgi:flavin reductase (DIM6/NTAB) family NADH-FMN oxidoreductase RutF
MIRMQTLTSGQHLRQAFGAFPSGVTALCALVDGEPVGMAASSFTSVSVEPALVSVCVQKSSTTWPLLKDVPRIGVSVLAEGHDAACLQLAKKDGDRFAGLEWDSGNERSLFMRGSSAWLECSLFQEVEAGDHMIALLEVHGFDIAPHTPPLIFHGSKFRKLSTA